MRSFLILVSTALTFVQIASAKAPSDCSGLLLRYIESQPSFLPWHQLWDAIDERGEVTFVLKVRKDPDDPDASRPGFPPHRTMRILPAFTTEDRGHVYYVAKGQAWDWQLYAADFGRDLKKPEFQILSAEHEIQKSSVLHELLNRAWWTAYPVKMATQWLAEKSKTYAKFARWSHERTADWAARLQARRLPQVPVDPALLSRVEEMKAPFTNFVKVPTKKMVELLDFLESRSPMHSLSTPGDLPKIFVDVMDQLDPAGHEEHERGVAALRFSPLDAALLGDTGPQHKILEGLRLVHELVRKQSGVEWKRTENYDEAFVESTVAAVRNKFAFHRNAPLRMTLDQWRSKQFATVFFDSRYTWWSYNQIATVITDEGTGRAWAVINESRMNDYRHLVRTLSALTKKPVPAGILRFLQMPDTIATGEPAQLIGELGDRLLDHVAYFKSVARISKDGKAYGLLIVPLN